MNQYKTSQGTYLKKSVIDRRITEAKREYIENFFFENGYLYCERSQRSDLPLECSHIISVRWCQHTGKSELAYCLKNLELLCREEHLKIESLPNLQRERMYFERLKNNNYE